MSTPLILFLGLTVATCVIAYWSDNLGKKLGKKRISLFGLRPRQTATIITMTSSWGIMILTLAVLLISSQSLKNALLSYDEVMRNYNELKEQRDQLAGQTNVLTRRNKNLADQSKKLQKNQKNLNQQVSKGRKQIAAIKRSRQQTEVSLAGAQNKLRLAQRGESTAKRRAASAQRQFAAVQRRFAAAQRRFSAVQSQYIDARAGLRQVQTHLNSVQATLSTLNTRLALRNAELKKRNADLQRLQAKNIAIQTQNLDIENAKTQAIIDRDQAIIDRDTVRTELGKLRGEIDDLEGQRKLLIQFRNQLSAGKVSFGSGQVLIDRTVPANLDSETAQRILAAFFEQGRQALKQTKTPEGIERTLELTLPIEGRLVRVEEANLTQQLMNYLSLLSTPASIRLVVAINHAESDPVIDTFVRVVPIETKFERDETITTATIDGTMGEAPIFNQLLALVNNGEQIARQQKGIDPVPTEENPYFYATGTNERIFEAIHKIQATGKKVQVRLVAADDLTTVDPLRVRFEIETSGT